MSDDSPAIRYLLCFLAIMFCLSAFFNVMTLLAPSVDTVATTSHTARPASDAGGQQEQKQQQQHQQQRTPRPMGAYEPLCRNPHYKCLTVKYSSSPLETFDCPKQKSEQKPADHGLWNVTVACARRFGTDAVLTPLMPLQDNYVYWFDQSFADELLRIVQGGSVLELGAGFACYSSYWRTSGKVTKLVAVDGARDVDRITNGHVQRADLAKPLQLGEKFDWVIMLEVAEHVPAEFEDVLVANVDRHAAHGIIISWALPGQGGNGHVNLRDNNYVINKIDALGWQHDVDATLRLRERATLGWFKKTPLVFRRRE